MAFRADPYIGQKLAVVGTGCTALAMLIGFLGAETQTGKLGYAVLGMIAFLLMCLVIALLMKSRRDGSIVGAAMIRPMKIGLQRPKRLWQGALIGRRSRPARRKVETEEDRRFQLRAASQFHVRELLFDGVDRQNVLGKVRAKAPGFPEERYEQALDEAQALVTSGRERALQRRSELIDAARKDDLLNSVFALRYFNERYSDQHVMLYRLGRINIHKTLRDLHPEAEVDAALIRVDALIKDAFKSVSYEPGAAEARMQELRQSHPGFNNRSLNAAMDWGYLINR